MGTVQNIVKIAREEPSPDHIYKYGQRRVIFNSVGTLADGVMYDHLWSYANVSDIGHVTIGETVRFTALVRQYEKGDIRPWHDWGIVRCEA